MASTTTDLPQEIWMNHILPYLNEEPSLLNAHIYQAIMKRMPPWPSKINVIGDIGDGFSPSVSNVTRYSFSQDDNHMAVGYDNGTIRFYSRVNGCFFSSSDAHSEKITTLIFSPSNPNMLISVSRDNAFMWLIFPGQDPTRVHFYTTEKYDFLAQVNAKSPLYPFYRTVHFDTTQRNAKAAFSNDGKMLVLAATLPGPLILEYRFEIFFTLFSVERNVLFCRARWSSWTNNVPEFLGVNQKNGDYQVFIGEDKGIQYHWNVKDLPKHEEFSLRRGFYQFINPTSSGYRLHPWPTKWAISNDAQFITASDKESSSNEPPSIALRSYASNGELIKEKIITVSGLFSGSWDRSAHIIGSSSGIKYSLACFCRQSQFSILSRIEIFDMVTHEHIGTVCDKGRFLSGVHGALLDCSLLTDDGKTFVTLHKGGYLHLHRIQG